MSQRVIALAAQVESLSSNSLNPHEKLRVVVPVSVWELETGGSLGLAGSAQFRAQYVT